jgi:hypothetical protein
MNILGLRCSNKDFAYVLMSGTKAAPQLAECRTLAYPKNFAHPRSLLWFTQEIEQLIRKHSVQGIVMKRSEGRSKGGSFEMRVEYEAAAYLAAARCNVMRAFKKVKSTLAKDLGLKGRAHYLDTSLNTSVIPGFADFSEKEQESILCAWSELG